MARPKRKDRLAKKTPTKKTPTKKTPIKKTPTKKASTKKTPTKKTQTKEASKRSPEKDQNKGQKRSRDVSPLSGVVAPRRRAAPARWGVDEKDNSIDTTPCSPSPKKKKRKTNTTKEAKKATTGKRPLKAAAVPESEDELFIVEAIVGERRVLGRLQYKVRWECFGPENDTWEPVQNLLGNPAVDEYIDEQKREGEDAPPSPFRPQRRSSKQLKERTKRQLLRESSPKKTPNRKLKPKAKKTMRVPCFDETGKKAWVTL